MENNVQQEDDFNDLPSFMSEVEEEQTENSVNSWLSSNLHKIMTIVSVIWFLIVGIYITKFYGWSNMFLLTPSEFGGFLAGITMPLAVIWMVIAYIDRGSGFKAEAKLLRTYMNQLVYPEEGAASTAKAMADAIREQVAELQGVTKLATEKTNEIKTELSARVDDFSKLVQILNEYSNKTINELNLGVSSLIENCNFVTSQTKNMTDDFLQSSEKIKNQVGDLTVSMTPMLQDVRQMAVMLNDIINDNHKKIAAANERFVEYSDIFGHLNENIAQVEKSIAAQKSAVEEQAKILDEGSKYLDSRLGEYGRLISMEVEAMAQSSATIDDNLQNHVNTIKATAGEISVIFDNVHKEIEQKSISLLNSSKANAENIVTSSKILDEEIKKLEDFTSSANDKNVQLREIAEKTLSKLDSIGNQIAGNTDILKTKAVETIDAFNEVSGNLKKNTQTMLETASQITAQAKSGNSAITSQTENMITYASQLENAKNNLEKIAAIMTNSSEVAEKAVNNYSKKVESLRDILNEQIKETQTAEEKSADLLTQVENKYNVDNIASFLKDSEDIIEKLESSAININHILTPDDEENLWKKYYSGDKNAFVRHISKSLTKKQIVAIHNEYEKNEEFRLMIDRYMREFENLLNAAKKTERYDTLQTMLYGSHIGKVYYIIAKALNKMD